jgi:hypothetical protein
MRMLLVTHLTVWDWLPALRRWGYDDVDIGIGTLDTARTDLYPPEVEGGRR